MQLTTRDHHATDPVSPILRTVLFVDVVASTHIVSSCGDEAWVRLLERHTKAMLAVSRRHGGHLAAFLGDGFLFQFDDPGEAVLAATRMHLAADVQGLFELRMGLDHGPLLPFGETWAVGLTLHVASRLTDWCRPSEIAMSGRCYEAARASAAIPPSVETIVHVRGVDEPISVHVIRPGERS